MYYFSESGGCYSLVPVENRRSKGCIFIGCLKVTVFPIVKHIIFALILCTFKCALTTNILTLRGFKCFQSCPKKKFFPECTFQHKEREVGNLKQGHWEV